MDQCKDREEGVLPSKTTLCGEHESQSKDQRKKSEPEPEPEPEPGPGPGPGPSCVSFKSDWSKDHPLVNYKKQRTSKTVMDLDSSEVPSTQSDQEDQTQLDSIFMLLEDNIVTFVKNELKKIQKLLSSDYSECFEIQMENENDLDGKEEEKS